MISSLSDSGHFYELPILFVTGLVAGFVDSIAGGGGLITLPMILSMGGDPQVALGTNKLQATFGAASATWHYAKAGAVELADCWRGCLITFIGAIFGTWASGRSARTRSRSSFPCSSSRWRFIPCAIRTLASAKPKRASSGIASI
jgi:uncharacterized membrane protein YfcA